MSLDTLLNPRSIAIVGATQDARRAGGQPFHSLTQLGYGGEVFAVNPRYQQIDGHPCFAHVDALPSPVDLAVIAVPATEVAATVEACGRKGIRYALILSAGFREIGERGLELEAQLLSALQRSGVKAVGPNCIGMMNVPKKVFAGFGAAFRKYDWRGGPIAMISQSGGFAYSIMTFCDEAGIGFDHMISTGNESSLGTLDFIEHFLEDEAIRLIAVYMEGIQDGKRLRALGRRALEVGKPIAVWKVGNTSTGRRAAVSHTANLTEEYDYYRDAFAEGGFVQIREIYDLIDCARVFRSPKRPRGNRVAVVTTSGGAGVLLTDACEQAGLDLPLLNESTVKTLHTVLPHFASIRNPIDVTAAIAQKRSEFGQATQAVLDDPNVDMLIVRSYPGRDGALWAEDFVAAANQTDKPILVSLTGTPSESSAWLPALEAAGIGCFEAPSRLVYAAACLNRFTRQREHLASASSVAAVSFESVAWPQQSSWDEVSAKQFLNRYHIPIPAATFIALGEEASLVNQAIDFPVVLKVVSPDLPHKSEAGGVRVGIQDRESLIKAIEQMKLATQRFKPGLCIRGWLIESMVKGAEFIVGALNNASFGPVIMVGMGGIYAELFQDVVRRYAPFDAEVAKSMILSLKGAKTLQGYRGQPLCDVEAFAQVLSQISYIVMQHRDELAELEINPLMVRAVGQGVVAVDAVIQPRSASAH
ncbi:MAG: acetate--CoA ligase family protein [Betaproteobacteria bacterium]